MTFNPLDVVVLDEDLPEHNLRCGDLGTVVELHDANAMDVEFLNAMRKSLPE